MRLKNLGGYGNINSFVKHRLTLLKNTGERFDDIFPLMFAEKENILWEESRGYRIAKTTYGEAYAKALELSCMIAGRFASLPADSVIGIAAENGPLFIELLWATLRAGFKPLLINTRLGAPVLERRFAASA